MRPASLDELGAGPALEALIDRTHRLTGLRITTEIDLAYEAGREPQRHVPETEVAIYRLVQEALTNAVKHAGDVAVHVAVADDGGRRRPSACATTAPASCPTPATRASGSSASASASRWSAAR